jgi:hypothetical protein
MSGPPTASFLSFSPLVPMWALALAGVAALAVLAIYAWGNGRARGWRAAILALGLVALANPLWVREQRAPLSDVALVVIDTSPSMAFPDRLAAREATRAALEQRLAALGQLEVQVIDTGPATDRTDLLAAVQASLDSLPADRLAAVIAVTDGQVHALPDDLPAALRSLVPGAPVHGLIVGAPSERDRRLGLLNQPTFAIVGAEVTVRFLVEDDAAPAGERVTVSLTLDGQSLPPVQASVGEPAEVAVPVARRGLNALGLSVPALADEVSAANNTAALGITGVRDRLRVLLITGEPYPGARVWRDLLKADPSVDLVHFTILRSPNKTDFTPVEEMSLIGFPTEELFEEKLTSFDLIIFDRYRRRGILPIAYFENMVSYVEGGGALLVVSGEAEAGGASLYRTPLAAVLPARPTGEVPTGAFRPRPSAVGARHVVMAPLAAARPDEGWGPWYMRVAATAVSGQTLLEGPEASPLLVIDRVGQGRVAQVLSDQLWLWARGHGGGGPYADLVRRVAHWLMQEPELEEEQLRLVLNGMTAALTLTTLADVAPDATLTAPDGASTAVPLSPAAEPGRFTAEVPAGLLGVYTAEAGSARALAVNGAANSEELADLTSTDAVMAQIARASRGGTARIGTGAEVRLPELRRVSASSAAAASLRNADWLGLRERGAYAVTERLATPLWPGLLGAMGFLLVGVLMWRREGR